MRDGYSSKKLWLVTHWDVRPQIDDRIMKDYSCQHSVRIGRKTGGP